VVSGTRVKSAMVVADHSGMCGSRRRPDTTGYESKTCAMANAKNVTHGDNQGKWAWNTIGTKQNKRCNFHKECPVKAADGDADGAAKVHKSEGRWRRGGGARTADG
jgi:hypothetical protein